MKIYLQICENENCGEVIGAFNKKQCKFCGGKDISVHHINFSIVLGNSTPYAEDNKSMGVLRNYKGCNHLFIREKPGFGNDCDNNGGYIHIPCIHDADEVEKLINAQISKEGNYIFKE